MICRKCGKLINKIDINAQDTLEDDEYISTFDFEQQKKALEKLTPYIEMAVEYFKEYFKNKGIKKSPKEIVEVAIKEISRMIEEDFEF